MATAREGGVIETLSVLEAAVELESGSISPQEAEALREIVSDEARHALLAWDTLRWGVHSSQGDSVRCLA